MAFDGITTKSIISELKNKLIKFYKEAIEKN